MLVDLEALLARWDAARAMAMAALARKQPPDLAYVEEILASPAAWGGSLEEELSELAREAKPIKALRASLTTMLWTGLANALRADAKYMGQGIVSIAAELGVGPRDLEKQLQLALQGDEHLDARVEVVRALLKEINLAADEDAAMRPVALRAYRSLLARATVQPRFLQSPHKSVGLEVLDEVVRVIGRHLGSNDVFVELAVEGVLARLLDKKQTVPTAKALSKVAATWNDHTVAAFVHASITKFEHLDREAISQRDAILRLVLPPLVAKGGPWMDKPAVARLLAKLKIRPRKKLQKLPVSFPLAVPAALALEKPYGTSFARAPARVAGMKNLSPALVELYRRTDGFGDLVTAKARPALQRRFLAEVKRALKTGEEVDHTGDIDVRSFAPVDQLLAVGKDGGGDTFFIDPRKPTRAGHTPVYRYVHDESCVVRPVAASLGSFVAQTILGDWAVRHGEEVTLARKAAAERKTLTRPGRKR